MSADVRASAHFSAKESDHPLLGGQVVLEFYPYPQFNLRECVKRSICSFKRPTHPRATSYPSSLYCLFDKMGRLELVIRVKFHELPGNMPRTPAQWEQPTQLFNHKPVDEVNADRLIFSLSRLPRHPGPLRYQFSAFGFTSSAKYRAVSGSPAAASTNGGHG